MKMPPFGCWLKMTLPFQNPANSGAQREIIFRKTI